MIAEDIVASDINVNEQSYDAEEGLPNGTDIKTKSPFRPNRMGSFLNLVFSRRKRTQIRNQICPVCKSLANI